LATVRTKIAHVFRRLGFGPTPADIDAWVSAGPQALIDNLLSRPAVTPTTASPNPWGFPTGTDYLAVNAYTARLIELMAFGPGTTNTGVTASNYNPLQERIAWILQGILVTAIADITYYEDVADHISVIRSSTFGSYKQLLLAVSKRTAMLKYLSGFQNTATHPNQNYARELMELFSLGRVDLMTGAPNYTQADIQEMARALTGWQIDWNGGPPSWNQANWDSGVKTFRGASLGKAKLPQVIDAITAHPAFQRFIPARFYDELIGIPPTPDVLTSLAAAWGPTGDILALVKAITKRPEFLSDQAIYARVKQPVELVASAARLLGFSRLAKPTFYLPYTLQTFGEHPLFAPNVAGFPRGDKWLGSTTLLTWSGVAGSMTVGASGSKDATPPNPTTQQLYSAATSATAATIALRMAGLGEAVSATTFARLNDYAQTGAWSLTKAAGLLHLLLLSPEFLVN
jgi:uncharacterized protein (DUF1800 family)